MKHEGIEWVRACMAEILDRAAAEQRDFTEDETGAWDAGKEYVETEQAKLDRAAYLRTVEERFEQPTPAADRPLARDAGFAINTGADLSFDAATRSGYRSGEIRDLAMRQIERATRDYGLDPAGAESAERLVRGRHGDELSRHIATYGSPEYASAFAKYITGRSASMTETELRAMSTTAANGGAMIPTHLDPSVILVNDGTFNPFRSISRVESLPSPGPNTWNGVTSVGVTASFDAEAAEVSDDAPTLVAPSIPVARAQAFVPASVEVLDDISGLEMELARLFADARDRLEASNFATGTGSNAPTGILTALDADTFSELNATTAAALGLVDLHAAYNALGARWQSRATWVMSPATESKIRQLGTAVSASFTGNLSDGRTQTLIGRPIVLSSDFPSPSVYTTVVENWLVCGDFQQYIVVDKVGSRLSFIEHLFGGNQRPTGQVGWHMLWRVGAEPVGTAAATSPFVLLQDKTSA